MESQDTEEYYSATYLKNERGWTNDLIEKYLQNADCYKSIPPFKSRISFYKKSRVETAEGHKNFQKILKKNKNKRCEVIAFVKKWNPEIPLMPMVALEKLAEEYERDFRDNHDLKYIGSKISQQYRNKLTVNYIKHKLTDYDHVLNSKKIRSNEREAVTMLKEKVLILISLTYPELKEECEAQIEVYNQLPIDKIPTTL